MFNWFDKLLVKIAKKILNKYAPTGEFIAYINEQEEKVLKKLGGYGQPINETGVKSFIPEWMKTIKNTYDEYKGLIDVGAGAAKYYIDYKDQKRRNEIEKAAYNEYMKQVAAAGQEAQAAVDLNLTPMEVTNVPTTKADVSDFTAVAARGGLMNLPTRQRKKYYAGTGEEEVMETEDEVLSPFDLQQETGIDLTGEQAFHDSGDPRTNAQNVWGSGQINQEDYQMNFEIFFQSGDWMDHISRGSVPENMQMASDPSWEAEWDDTYENYKAKQIELGQEFVSKEEFMMDYQDNMAIGGIAGLRHGGRPGYQFGIGPQQGMMPQGMMPQGMMPQGMMPQGMMPQGMMPQQGLRHGGRPGYAFGPGPVMDQETTAQSITLPDGGEEVVTDSMTDIKGQTAGPEWYIQRIEHLEFLFGDELTEDEIAEIAYDSDKYYEKIGHDPYAKGGKAMAQGGRIGYDDGGSAEDKLMARVQELQDEGLDFAAAMAQAMKELSSGKAQGGRIGYAQGSGIMDLGGMEKDYRTTGGFVPIGAYEKKDDVPARLSKNEFVMTADAVRAAGGGSINKGAQRMYDTMKHLEASPQSQRMIS